MGKFFKYEDSNWRTFVIDSTGGTIKRPKRKVTLADFVGVILDIDGAVVIPVNVTETSTTIDAIVITDDTPTVATLTYTKATDTFTLGEDALDNIMIDEYGREEMYI